MARLAEAARVEREAAGWVAAPARPVPDAADADALALAAVMVHAAGDWRASIAMHRRLLVRRSLDARFCAWRAAATQAMVCAARGRPAGR